MLHATPAVQETSFYGEKIEHEIKDKGYIPNGEDLLTIEAIQGVALEFLSRKSF